MGLGSKLMAAGLAALMMLAGPAGAAGAACLPPGLPVSGTPPQSSPAMEVYLDGSYSMVGYADGATGSLRPMGDALAVLDNFSASRRLPSRYYRFGKAIAPLQGAAQAVEFARPGPYRCGRCDNQESRIDLVLNTIRDQRTRSLSVVITDLWLDDTAFSGSAQVALGIPLTDILRQGRSIAVVGLQAPYKGRIYDMPGGHPYDGASERPLFAVIIGTRAEVGAVVRAMATSGSPSFTPQRLRYALFSTEPVDPWRAGRAPLRAGGAGAQEGAALPEMISPGLQQFRYRVGTGSQIAGVLDASQGIPPAAVWAGPLAGSTRVWVLQDQGGLKSCRSGTWAPFSPLRQAWRGVGGAPRSAQFVFSDQTAGVLAPGRSYLVAGVLGPSALQMPNPAAQWMRDWSFDADQAGALVARRPAFFKTLNLGDLAGIMEQAIERAKPPSGRAMVAFAIVVKVDR